MIFAVLISVGAIALALHAMIKVHAVSKELGQLDQLIHKLLDISVEIQQRLPDEPAVDEYPPDMPPQVREVIRMAKSMGATIQVTKIDSDEADDCNCLGCRARRAAQNKDGELH